MLLISSNSHYNVYLENNEFQYYIISVYKIYSERNTTFYVNAQQLRF